MPSYNSSVNTQTETILQVTWKDESGNVIVSGEKIVKGGPEEAAKVEQAFAEDLRRNFADRFPPPPEPDPMPMDGGME
jgi:hypothetical protein